MRRIDCRGSCVCVGSALWATDTAHNHTRTVDTQSQRGGHPNKECKIYSRTLANVYVSCDGGRDRRPHPSTPIAQNDQTNAAHPPPRAMRKRAWDTSPTASLPQRCVPERPCITMWLSQPASHVRAAMAPLELYLQCTSTANTGQQHTTSATIRSHARGIGDARDRDVRATGPNLSRLFTIPPPTEHICALARDNACKCSETLQREDVDLQRRVCGLADATEGDAARLRWPGSAAR